MPEENQLSPVSAEFLRPLFSYDKLSDARLLTGFYLESVLFEMQLYLMMLHRSGLPLPDSPRAWQLKARELSLTDIEYLYTRSHDDLLIQLMVLIKCQKSEMQKEVHKRLDVNPIGMSILMERWNEVERFWIQKRRLKVDDISDVKQDGMTKGIEFLNSARKKSLEEEEHQAILNLPSPAFPLSNMDELEQASWCAIVEDTWRPSLHAIFGNVIPLVRGDLEDSKGAVDNFLLKNQRKDQQRKRISSGTDKFPKNGPEACRADWDFSKAALAARSEVLKNETTGTRILGPEENLTRAEARRDKKKEIEEAARHAYEIAIRRSGKKGVDFLDALKKGQTVTDAAKAAGIARRTAGRINEAIRNSHPIKRVKKQPNSA